jgi:hypothetical protein
LQIVKLGGDKRVRTAGLTGAIRALYQLSYIPFDEAFASVLALLGVYYHLTSFGVFWSHLITKLATLLAHLASWFYLEPYRALMLVTMHRRIREPATSLLYHPGSSRFLDHWAAFIVIIASRIVINHNYDLLP